MKKPLVWLLAAVLFIFAAPAARADDLTGKVLILYDSSSSGWLGNVYAKMLANLMGHFQLSNQITAVESYSSNSVNTARATFYFGTVYDNALPAQFLADVLATTNPVCWMKYNLWKLDWDPTYTAAFESKYGIQFIGNDSSGYSNILYKSQFLNKNQADPELGQAASLGAAVAMYACKDTNTCIPYVLHGSNFWYVADNPFAFMGQEDRYLAFADLLHDILGINHATNHSAYIRIHTLFDTNSLHQFADYLKTSGVPYGLTVTPDYKDPFGVYNSGTPVDWHLTNSILADYLSGLKYMATNYGQVLLLGYTHQYDTTNNPNTGATWDDYEFWRVTFGGLFQPVDEDANSWVQARLTAATNELAQAGLPAAAGWITPFYYASGLDYRNIGTNFPTVMARTLYFADDYTAANQHFGNQLFPYVIYGDIYGQHIVPENIGNILPPDYFTPAVTATDLARIARENLVVRDGWASAYMSAFYNLTNLQALVTNIQALGYTYVPVGPPWITAQPAPAVQTNYAGSNISYTISVLGIPPLAYQWYLNTSNVLVNATNISLSLTNIQMIDSGGYQIVVSNFFGSVTSSVASLFVIWDTDGDGLADAWELMYFGNLSQDGNGDPDGDGLSNLQEYQSGTNPTLDNSTQSGSRLNYTYDLAGRLQSVVGAKGETLGNDAEGNLQQDH